MLVHGLSGSSRWWARNIGALAERFHVYVIDLIGFGDSRGDQRFMLDEAAGHLARWIEYALEGAEHHFPIHIPRHVDSLRAVVERLEARTGVSAGGAAPSWHAIDAPADKLVQYLMASVGMELGAGTAAGAREPLLAALVESDGFRRLLQRQIVSYQVQRSQADSGLHTREILEVGAGDFAQLVADDGLRVVRGFNL